MEVAAQPDSSPRLYNICATMCNITAQTESLMKTDMLSTRIDHDTKVAFSNICDELGLSPSQAIKLFARAVINYGGIPFELKAPQPNETSAAAMQELLEGKGHRAKSLDSLVADFTDGKVTHVQP
jgi:DNA-damage-inducible protein J